MRNRSMLVVLLVTAGCEGALSPPGRAEPTLSAITGPFVVGSTVTLEGEGFVPPEEGWVDVRFEGVFRGASGSESPVDLTVSLQADADGQLPWTRFGGHRVPFGVGDELGELEGSIAAANRYFDGVAAGEGEASHPDRRDAVPSHGRAVRLPIEPSIVVLDFRASNDQANWESDCIEPTPVAFAGVDYVMRVKALGFGPTRVEMQISEGLEIDGQPSRGITSVDVEPSASDPDEAALIMRFAQVPDHAEGFRMTVLVAAWDDDGHRRSLAYPFVVRRPLQVYFTTPMEIAEVYAPEPVTGCTPGGETGVESQYSESHSETRTREIAHATQSGWELTRGAEHAETWSHATSTGIAHEESREVRVADTRVEGGSSSQTRSFSRTNDRSRSRTVGFERSSSDSWQAGGSGGLDLGVFSIGADASRGWVDGESRSRSSTRTSGRSTTRGSSSSSEAHWQRTQTYEEMNGYSDTTTYEETDEYAVAETRSESIAASLGATETESLSVSTTDTTSLQTTADIPPGRFGVWYRQTTRLVRQGVVVAYDFCGNGSPVGTVTLEDWAWAPNLAVGPSCDGQLPPSNFPAAQCYTPPCGAE